MTDSQVWINLKEWVEREGGFVHPSLDLATSGDGKNSSSSEASGYRGVFCSHGPVSAGELLIRLPATLAMDGHDLPYEYYSKGQHRRAHGQPLQFGAASSHNSPNKVSPWLRCLASFYRYCEAVTDTQAQPEVPTEEPVDETITPTTAALYDARIPPVADAFRKSTAYLDSLPSSYETIWQWTAPELETYLAGTTSPGGGPWQDEPGLVQDRYKKQVRPYLQYLQVGLASDPNEEYQRFAHVCQIMSTRCFHVAPPDEKDDTNHSTNESENWDKPPPPLEMNSHHSNASSTNTYMTTNTTATPSTFSGPFLLPMIDLLNHSSSTEECSTTLRRMADSFVMMAERPLAMGEEVLHSYGNHLTASQLLHTFGFVPLAAAQTVALHAERRNKSGTVGTSVALHSNSPVGLSAQLPVTPLVVDRQVVMDACYEVIRSNFQGRLAKIMEEHDMEDEVWPIPVDQPMRDASFLPEVFVLRCPEDSSGANSKHPLPAESCILTSTSSAQSLESFFQTDSEDAGGRYHVDHEVLPNELITCACLPFLPKCAYREAARNLLNATMLQDYYLGKLVCVSLLKALERKKNSYHKIVWNGRQGEAAVSTTNKMGDNGDAALLLELITQEQKEGPSNPSRARLIYALTVRLEEQESLHEARREVIRVMACLDEETEHTEEYDKEDADDVHKRQKC